MRRFIAAGMAIIILLMWKEMPVFGAEGAEKTPSGICYSDLETQLNDYIDVRKDTTSSVSITVFKETNDIASVIYGDTSTKDGVKADEDTVYEWGSISKMLIWTSIMQLWEQGKLELDTDIRTYLPEDFLMNLTYVEPVTMLHLMNHTAGFQETTWDVEVTVKKDIVSLKDALLNTAPPQIYKPGTVSSYSNWGAALAAYIVEYISGMDYADYVHQFIFEPLGMAHTFIRPDGSDNGWAENQRKRTNAYLNMQGAYEDYGECRRYILLYPAGSATGTMNDLVRFAKAFLSDSAECPLFSKNDTLALMLSPTLYYDGTDVARMCHGLFSLEYGVPLIGHAGNTTGFSANLMLDLKSKTGIVVMTNEVAETTYNYGLLSLVFGDCEGEPGFIYDDLSGIYCNSRANYDKSFLKIYGVIGGLLPLRSNGREGNYNTVLMPGEVTQISENACIMDDRNGTKTYLSIQRDRTGNIIALQSMGGMTFVKAEAAVFGGQIVLLLLLVMSSVWSIIMLVAHGVCLRKFNRSNLYKRKMFQFLTELFIIIAAAVIFWLVFISDSFIKEQVIWKCVFIIFSTLAVGVTLLMGWLSGKRAGTGTKTHNLGKRQTVLQRLCFVMTDICGIIMIINVLYWHFYQFWGC